MLPRRYIEEWKEFAPWSEDSQVEQDLVIEKALVQLFSDSFLNERLAFRGGTARRPLWFAAAGCGIQPKRSLQYVKN